MYLKTAVIAGKPDNEKDYIKKQISGVEIFLGGDIKDSNIKIDWVGFWKIGQFVVAEQK